jgi:RNA recognition motif-containing protein
MSLFIGNIARDVNENDIHDEFDKIGACDFRFKVSKHPI